MLKRIAIQKGEPMPEFDKMTPTEKECREALRVLAIGKGGLTDYETIQSLIDQHFKKEIKEKIKE